MEVMSMFLLTLFFIVHVSTVEKDLIGYYSFDENRDVAKDETIEFDNTKKTHVEVVDNDSLDTSDATISISVDKTRVGMGKSIAVKAKIANADDESGKRYLLLPYLDGYRWGAHTYTDEAGLATCYLPLPNHGVREIQVQVLPSREIADWIWAKDTKDNQTVYFQHVFTLAQGARLHALLESASLWVAVDDGAKIWLNGHRLEERYGWKDVKPIQVDAKLLQRENVLSIEAHNGTGPAGLLVKFEICTGDRKYIVTSKPDWRIFSSPPKDWPQKSHSKVKHAAGSLGNYLFSRWSFSMHNWANVPPKRLLITGHRVPPDANLSNSVQVRVGWRDLEPIPKDPDHLVGMQWEPWFTPHNPYWQTAQAVPLLGFYQSYNSDVIRQHMIWLAESGIDFLVVDWTNHLWGKDHWNERPEHTNEIIHATTLTLETLASMREEGLSPPKVVLYLGLNNGPATTMTAVNEEIDWIYHNYIRNQRFNNLFVEYLGKPLLLIHNGGGPRWIKDHKCKPVNDKQFTIRWQSSQQQQSLNNEDGYWSWMDGVLEPPVTYYENEPEALTVSTAFFGAEGWLGPGTYGRRNGWTYIETFRQALKYKPRFIQLHQFNEFAGQPEGHGYGPDKNVYVDSYSVEFSDDIEPTSLTTPAYRGNGGWGFYYLNLTRALVDLYRQDTIETTVVVVSSPDLHEVVEDDKLKIVWTWVGKKPKGFSISLDGKVIGRRQASDTTATIELSQFSDGLRNLRLTAEGTKSRYILSYTQDSLPLEDLVSAYCEVPFTLKRRK